MVYVIEEAFNISVHYIIYLICHDMFIYPLDCVVTALIWTKTVGKLLYRLKYVLENTLNHFVFK